METISNPKETKARKNHNCNFCSYKIPKGDTYIKSTHVHDGTLYDWKTHKYCSDIANRLNMYDYCDEGVTQDDFMGAIHEEYLDIVFGVFGYDRFGDEYNEILEDLRYVQFKHKLGRVIRHYKKIDNQ